MFMYFLCNYFFAFNPNQSGMPADSKGGAVVFKDQLVEEAGRGGRRDFGYSRQNCSTLRAR